MDTDSVKKKTQAKGNDEKSASSVEDSVTGNDCRAATEAFSNQLVLQQIFMHSDVKSLIGFSLVNKLWCTTARLVLKSHKRCLATLKGINPCEELLQLNRVLTRSTNPPFTGIAMRMNKVPRAGSLQIIGIDELPSDSDFSSSADEYDSEDSTDSSDSPYVHRRHYIGSDDSASSSYDEDEHDCINAKVSESYSALLRKLNFRHVEIFWKETNPTCPAERFLAKLFRVKGDEIKELKIRYLPPQVNNLAKHFRIKKSDWLPNLRVLDYSDFEGFPSRRNVLKYELINAAPKLEEVLGVNWKHDLRFFVDQKKTGLIKNYLAYHGDFFKMDLNSEEKEVMAKFASSGVRLTRFSLTGNFISRDPECGEFKFAKECLKSLLESSSATLEEIQLDQTHFVHLVPHVLVQPFENLVHLDMEIAPFLDERMGFPTLEKFDWSQWFPSLQTVKICKSTMESSYNSRVAESEHEVRRMFAESNVKEDFRQRSFGSPCLTATKIAFEGGFICKNFHALTYLSRVFPNLKELVFDHASKMDNVLPFVWALWPELESINITLKKGEGVDCNYDAVFCGISEDQAIAYRKKTVKALERMKIKPGESSIVSLKCLKILRIEFPKHNKCSANKPKWDSRSAFLSHVTGLLAFSQKPELRVEIVRELCSKRCAYTFEHLRPFLRLTDTKGKYDS